MYNLHFIIINIFFSIRFWNCSDSVVFCVFHFIKWFFN